MPSEWEAEGEEKAEMMKRIKLHFPAGHLGATSNDDAITLVIRALSLKYGEEDSSFPADKYGVDYEDETICIHHDVQDADCSCIYASKEEKWLAKNPHSKSCFVLDAGRAVAKVERQNPLPEFSLITAVDDHDVASFVQFWQGGAGPTKEQVAAKKARERRREKDRKAWSAARRVQEEAVKATVLALAARHNVAIDKRYADWEWKYKCNCGQAKRRREWERQHTHIKPCPVWWMGQPNFLHKPTGIEIRWYKYIGRDMKCNRERLTRAEWKQIRELITDEDIKRVISISEERHASFAAMIDHANKRMAEAK
jgi:hypothetical protein